MFYFAVIEFVLLIALALWASHIAIDSKRWIGELVKERAKLAEQNSDAVNAMRIAVQRIKELEEESRARNLRPFRSNPNRMMRFLEAVDPVNVEAKLEGKSVRAKD